MTADPAPSSRRREPDPKVRRTLVAAATKVIREEGVRGLSVAGVLDRAGLGTRAFYRHFDSKDQLVAAVFLDMATAEARRLGKRMAAASGPVEAVIAWIDGRLDLAFSADVRTDLRQMSVEAQAQMFASPEIVGSAYAVILTPLIEQLQRGLAAGVFVGIDPAADAQSIQGVMWSSVERQWATGAEDRDIVRRRIVRFCLRGLGTTNNEGEKWI